MKKGILGIITLIVGIVTFGCAIVAGFYPDATIGSIGWIARMVQLLWFVAPVLGIIACVKKSNTKLAIVGMVLGAVSFFAPWIIGLIVNSIK